MPKKTKKEKAPAPKPLVDPILPLPFGTGLPFLRDGDGKNILDDDKPKTVSMTYRAAWVMWEQAEALARKNYPRLIGGPMANGAEAALEAVIAFRSALGHHGEVPRFTEQEAQALRNPKKKSAHTSGAVGKVLPGQNGKTPCTHDDKKRVKTKLGERLWKCLTCGEKWARTTPSEVRQKPEKAPKAARGTISTGKKASAKKTGKKKSLKTRQ